MNALLTRRLAGSAAGLLLMALIVMLFMTRYAPPSDSYTIDVVLGRAGSGLTVASDVKARGVRIGAVDELTFEDGQAMGKLRIDGDVQLPKPEHLTVVVTAKTLLGEKQVEISFPDDQFGVEPFLAQGEMVVAARQPTELNEVLDTLEPFLDSINGEELATVIEALSEQEGEAEVFAENLELTTELAEFGRRTADQTLENLDNLADLAAGLRPTIDSSLDRTRASLPEASRLLRENPDDIETALIALSEFSVELSEFLEVEEDRIDTLFETGNPIGEMLEAQRADVGSLVDGLSTYLKILGGGAGLLDDGTIFAYFKLFVSPDGFTEFSGGGQ